jgi:hypothetical protein
MGIHVIASVDAQNLEAILENFVGVGGILASMGKGALMNNNCEL